VFKNNLDRPASVHAHGVFYAKNGEGAPYQDGTGGADKADDAVAPGTTHTYTWQVPERAGPGPMDPSSILWMYHSHVDEVRDIYSGLQGPIVVTRRGMTRPDGTPPTSTAWWRCSR
jgi:FtsP/CotA-like multicopper oxidase with cupredoxin domain